MQSPDVTPDELEQLRALHKMIAWRSGATLYRRLYHNAQPPDMRERLLALHYDLQIAPGIVRDRPLLARKFGVDR